MNKKDALILFRNGDSFFTQIEDIHTPESLAQRMCGGGYVVCVDERWGAKQTIVVNLSDVYAIKIDG